MSHFLHFFPKKHRSQIPVPAGNGVLSSGRAEPATNFGKGDWKRSGPVGSDFPFSSQTIFQGISFYILNNDIKKTRLKKKPAGLQIGTAEGRRVRRQKMESLLRKRNFFSWEFFMGKILRQHESPLSVPRPGAREAVPGNWESWAHRLWIELDPGEKSSCAGWNCPWLIPGIAVPGISWWSGAAVQWMCRKAEIPLRKINFLIDFFFLLIC